jgi:RHS repeat-associated protein
MKNWIIAALVLGSSVKLSAADEVVSSQLTDLPGLDSPTKGSIGGFTSALQFDGAGMSQGNLTIAMPLSLPATRGPLLLNPVPSYSQSHGLSEYGLGWKQNICIERTRLKGEVDFKKDDFNTPFGLMSLGTDGFYYPYHMTSRYKLENSGDRLTVYSPEGVTYTFGGNAAESSPAGIYRYCLSHATDRWGFQTRYTYFRNQSGKLFLTNVFWGSPGENWNYQLKISLEQLANPVYLDYRSGTARAMDQKVKSIDLIQMDGQIPTVRHSYSLTHQNLATSSAFALTQLQKTFSNGFQEPPVRFTFGEWKADRMSIRTSAALSQFTSELGLVYFNSNAIGLADFQNNGLLGFENNRTRERFINTGEGFTREPTWNAGWDIACGMKGNLAKSRFFQKMQGLSGDLHVVNFNPRSATGYDIVICSKEGKILSQMPLSGSMGKDGSTHITDLNRDGLPDLVSLQSGFLQIYENRSTADEFKFVAMPFFELDKILTESPAFWTNDYNGDGMQDIVVKLEYGFKVYYGQGQYRYSKPAIIPTLTKGSQPISLKSYTISLIDINGDGLKDALLTVSTGFRLLFQKAGELREDPSHTFSFYQGANQGRPILGSFDKSGGLQIALADGKGSVKIIDITQPQTGLLETYADGKGGTLKLTYRDAYPEAGIGSRMAVLNEILKKTIGQPNKTESWVFSQPVVSPQSGRFLGFGEISQTDTARKKKATVAVDERQGPMVLESSQWDAKLNITQTQLTEYEDASFAGLSYKRPQIIRTQTSSGGPVFESSAQALQYDGLCPSTTITVNPHGNLIETRELDQLPDLDSFIMCLPKRKTLKGTHTDTSKDFTYDFTFNRNQRGQASETLLNNRLLQKLTFDELGRMLSASSPTQGTRTYGYWNDTKRLISTTDPTGVVTQIQETDLRSDLPLMMSTDHGGETYEQGYRYQANELLSSNWDNITQTNSQDPLISYQYVYPTELDLGLVGVTQKGDAGQSIRAQTFIDGSGAEKAQLTLGQTWAADWIKESQDEGYTEIVKRLFKPLQDSELENRLALLDQGVIQKESRTSSLAGLTSEMSQLIQQEVTQTVTTLASVKAEGFLLTSRENGKIDETRLEDGSGRVLWRRLPGMQTFQYTYDVLGRIVEVTLPSGTKQRSSYNAWGQPAEVFRSDLGSYRYSYDAEGNLAKRQIVQKNEQAISTYTILQRDAAQRILSSRQESAVQTRDFAYTYDGKRSDGKLVTGQKGFLTSVSSREFAKHFEYRADGVLERQDLSLPGGLNLAHSQTHTPTGKLRTETLRVTHGNETRSVEQSFSYNERDQLVRVAVNGKEQLTVQYDDIGRLASVSWGAKDQRRYTFDQATGQVNGLSMSGSRNLTYRWDLNDRAFIEKESYSSNDSSEVRTFDYYDNGFLRAALGSQDELFDYSADGMMSNALSQTKDSFGRLTGKPGRTYVYGDIGEIIGLKEKPELSWIYDETGQFLAKKKGDRIVLAKLGGFVIREDLGIVKAVVLDGMTVGYLENDVIRPAFTDRRSTLVSKDGLASLPSAYGQQMTQDEAVKFWGFAQTVRDDDLGLVRMGHRYYDAETGSFVSPDPYMFENPDQCVSNPIDCNLFGYARNNPLRYTDASGFRSFDTITPAEMAPLRGYESQFRQGQLLGAGMAIGAGAAAYGGTVAFAAATSPTAMATLGAGVHAVRIAALETTTAGWLNAGAAASYVSSRSQSLASSAMNLAQMSYQRVATTEAYFQGRWESSAINSTISGILGYYDQNGPAEAMANPIDGAVGAFNIVAGLASGFDFKQQSVPNSEHFETIKSYNIHSKNDYQEYFGAAQ